jgi:hypothetical protein
MEIRTSEALQEICSALAKAQGELENVEKTGKNPHYQSKYPTLSAVLDEVRPKFSRHGIGIIQFPFNGNDGEVGILTRLTHASGQWMEGALFVRPAKFDAQGVGSVISYLRRYTLMAMAGLAAEDDDGNAAIERPQTTRPAARPNGAVVPPGRPQLLQIAERRALEYGAAEFARWLAGLDQSDQAALSRHKGDLALIANAAEIAKGGQEAFRNWWKGLVAPDRDILRRHIDTLHHIAAQAETREPGEDDLVGADEAGSVLTSIRT